MWEAKLTRSRTNVGEAGPTSQSTPDEVSHPKLLGWEEFERDGLLR